MARIRSKNTTPERILRSILWSLGYRYRIHSKTLPGKPDIVFKKRNKLIFVNGCFWHQHSGCGHSRIPDSNKDYWLPKLMLNIERDARNIAELEALGWDVKVVWECQLKNLESIKADLIQFLGAPKII